MASSRFDIPRITTIVPTFRRPAQLARALESVSLQTYPLFALRVYDNASGDGTAEVVRKYAAGDSRFTYHVHPSNIGSEANFRFGLEQVDTEFFSFLSDDDLLLPRFYETALAALDDHPDAAMASTSVIHFNRLGQLAREAILSPGVHEPPEGLVAMLNLNQPTWTGTLFRRSVVAEVGTIDDRTVIDLDLELRIAAHHPFVVLPEPGALLSAEDHFGKCLRWAGQWELTIEKIEGDESLPAEVRELARKSLERRLKGMVYATGMTASRMGRREVAREAVSVLATQYRDRWGALLVGAATLITPLIGPPVKGIRNVARRVRGNRPSASDRLRAELRVIAPKLADLL
jgi:glycosyltransferase involved in cell wall biosynthesis